ncbi:hypothetical protein EHM69_04865 [candidate division KSB1 bacterium]|nr:MAG: hypothetical protein EHM69_04865 [candidate division KSB1 bacterium]
MIPFLSKMLAFSLLFSLLLPGCGKKKEQAADTLGPMLEAGTGALLVAFPRLPEANRENWLAQVTVIGPSETKSLPRIPLADQQAVMILNLNPGQYSVVAQAWLRKNNPHAGGSLSGVTVRAGEITILQGSRLSGTQTAQPLEPLIALNPVPWSLSAREKFHEFVADVLRTSVKG